MTVPPETPVEGSTITSESAATLWNRLTLPLRKAIFNAQDQGFQQGTATVDASQLFAGFLLLGTDASNGLRALRELGVDVEAVTGSLQNSGFISTSVQRPSGAPTTDHFTQLKASPEGLAMMLAANDAADRLGHDRVGTEHLLLAFLNTPESNGYRVLNGFNVTSERVRGRLEEWQTLQTYQQEQYVVPGSTQKAFGQSPLTGIVVLAYGWSRMVNLATIVAPLLYMLLARGGWIPVLNHYAYFMAAPISRYIVPYVASTYALSYLLRSRASRNLFGASPTQAMDGLRTPFLLSVFAGAWLFTAVVSMLLPMIAATSVLFGVPLASIKDGGARHDLAAPIMCYIAYANCAVTLVTHWLLTFNIRGKQLANEA